MSEWPGTCGISRCIIDMDEKAKLIVLIRNDSSIFNHGGGFTNITANWTPVMFPLTGIYDGWGKIIDIEVDNDDNPHFMLEFFNSHLKKKQIVVEDADEYCPKEVFEDISKLVLAIERGAVQFKSIYTGKLVEVSLMLVLDEMYSKSLEVMKKGIVSWLDPYQRIEKIENGTYDISEGQRIEDCIAKLSGQAPRKVSPFIEYLYRSGDGHHYFSESSKVNASTLTDTLAKEAIVFRAFLDSTRQSYAPQLAGGADFSYDLSLKWNAESGKIMKALKKRQDKKYAE